MNDLKKETIEKIKAGKEVTFEELKPLLRPEGIQNGVMKVDPEKCTSCGLCIQNCPFKCWEMGKKDIPRLKEGYACFSCFNCMVACPVGAGSIVKTYDELNRKIPLKLDLDFTASFIVHQTVFLALSGWTLKGRPVSNIINLLIEL